MTTVPGLLAKHVYVTDACRENRTDMGALNEALDRIDEEFHELLKNWPQGHGHRFHVMLSVEPAECDKRNTEAK